MSCPQPSLSAVGDVAPVTSEDATKVFDVSADSLTAASTVDTVVGEEKSQGATKCPTPIHGRSGNAMIDPEEKEEGGEEKTAGDAEEGEKEKEAEKLSDEERADASEQPKEMTEDKTGASPARRSTRKRTVRTPMMFDDDTPLPAKRQRRRTARHSPVLSDPEELHEDNDNTRLSSSEEDDWENRASRSSGRGRGRGRRGGGTAKAKAKSRVTRRKSQTTPQEGEEASVLEDVKPCLDGVVPHPDDFKISSWNVNGLRSVLKPSAQFDGKAPLLAYVEAEAPDVLCLNETKIHGSQTDEFRSVIPGYKAHYVCSQKKGYAGVAVFWKESLPFEPKFIEGLGNEEHDSEGRLLTAEFPAFSLIAAYVVNAGRGLPRLTYRVEQWDRDLKKYMEELRERRGKPVILCGDLNVAHEEIDIWNSKGNQKSAGHTKEERESFGGLLEGGSWIDVFRKMNPDKVQYTYWSTAAASFLTNKGWRLDYFVVSKDGFESCEEVITRDGVRGSDHCPVVLLLNRKAALGQ